MDKLNPLLKFGASALALYLIFLGTVAGAVPSSVSVVGLAVIWWVNRLSG